MTVACYKAVLGESMQYHAMRETYLIVFNKYNSRDIKRNYMRVKICQDLSRLLFRLLFLNAREACEACRAPHNLQQYANGEAVCLSSTKMFLLCKWM